MTQSLPPIQPRKQKNRSMIAIILAVLLHVLIAVIVYFSIFYNKPSSTEKSLQHTDERPLSISIIKEPQQASSDPTVTPIDAQNKVANKTATSTHKQKSITQSTTPQSNGSAIVEPSTNLAANNETVVLTESAGNNQQNSPVYTLKQTKEYQQLDTEIDKDNEQLSKLIGEVKRRNQSQIQQHQIEASSTKSTVETPLVQHDYPITPISPLAQSSTNKAPALTESLEADK
jgi:flagellar basal body-associated protein FliL